MFTTDLLLYSCGSDMSSISLELSYTVAPLTNNYTGVGRLIFFILFFLLGINCSCTAVQSIILIISHIQTLFFRRTADFDYGLLLFFFPIQSKESVFKHIFRSRIMDFWSDQYRCKAHFVFPELLCSSFYSSIISLVTTR